MLVHEYELFLAKKWTPKVTVIEEAKDLSTLPLEQLLGSLMTHERTMKSHECWPLPPRLIVYHMLF
ncbi:UBN2 domain-containing protein [Cephalotus follicularis]|uniref:UBN2 domain-containing protein n=1 Tax=Cephalotus follicularis TaxID=3775 RepID=A0A1Q3C0J0_CEPFO|nr:UBN2 domain-containing protein [Cephalotus follicularis]